MEALSRAWEEWLFRACVALNVKPERPRFAGATTADPAFKERARKMNDIALRREASYRKEQLRLRCVEWREKLVAHRGRLEEAMKAPRGDDWARWFTTEREKCFYEIRNYFNLAKPLDRQLLYLERELEERQEREKIDFSK